MRDEATLAPLQTLQPDATYGDVGLSGIEIASGLPLGPPEHVDLPRVDGGPRHMLEHLATTALQRPPCVVAFSGGRDSSALLAVAAHVAAREGLDPPVALTQRFPGVPATAETEWQELVVAHLGISDWEVIDQDEDFDILGPLARSALSRHGSMYPMNSHFALPLLERAGGGTVITGLDGDTLFGGWRWRRVGDVLGRREPPRPRDAVTAAHRLAPRRVQHAVMRRLDPGTPLSWLTEEGQRLCLEQRIRNLRDQPRRFDRYVEWFAGCRHIQLVRRQLELFAEDAGARIVHPFLEPSFLSALAPWGGRHGRGGRTELLQALFGDLLPERVLTRATKARFDAAYLSSYTREFAAAWDGSAAGMELVDAGALRAELAQPLPVTGIGQLLQWMWLSTRGREPR